MCLQAMPWSFTQTAAARLTEKQAPGRVSACTGASTIHCETHVGRGLFLTDVFIFVNALSHLWVLSFRNVAERLPGRQTNQRAEIQVKQV